VTGRIRPVALGTPEADRLLADMPEARRMESWHLVDESGEVHSRGAGFAPLLRELPLGEPLALLPALFPHEAEGAYRLVAQNRTTIGRLIPDLVKFGAEWLIARRAG
jgi:hypothetical protein